MMRGMGWALEIVRDEKGGVLGLEGKEREV